METRTSITRRATLLGLAGAFVATVCTREAARRRAHTAARAAATPMGSPAPGAALDEFLDLLSRHRADVGLVSYAVREGRPAPGLPQVRHAADRRFPVASAVKLLHVTAYGGAAAAGAVRPDERIRLGDWERYLLPGTDGRAHQRALQTLGLRVANGHAADPHATVAFDQVVSAMIEQSDNAAADYVRHRLGPAALAHAAWQAGHTRIDPVPSLLGQMLLGFAGDSPYQGMDGIRRLARTSPGRRFALAAERERRYVAGDRPAIGMPGYDAQAAWAETTTALSPRLLPALPAYAVAGRDAAAAIVRRHLEWPMRQGVPLPSGLVRYGTKGGTFAGMLTEASYTVAEDGTARVTAIALHRLASSDWTSLLTTYAQQQMIVRMGTDPSFVTRVAAALRL